MHAGHQNTWSVDSGSPLRYANGGSGVGFGGAVMSAAATEAAAARAADLLLVMAHADTDTKASHSSQH